jgi:hypothetical protein
LSIFSPDCINPTLVDEDQYFNCTELGGNVIEVTALNNIGVAWTEQATATVLDLHPPNMTCPSFVSLPCGDISPNLAGKPRGEIDNCLRDECNVQRRGGYSL